MKIWGWEELPSISMVFRTDFLVTVVTIVFVISSNEEKSFCFPMLQQALYVYIVLTERLKLSEFAVCIYPDMFLTLEVVCL